MTAAMGIFFMLGLVAFFYFVCGIFFAGTENAGIKTISGIIFCIALLFLVSNAWMGS